VTGHRLRLNSLLSGRLDKIVVAPKQETNTDGGSHYLVGIINRNASRYIAGKLLQESFHEFEDSQYEAIDLGRPSLKM
jgi:hypothetical protein